MMIHTHEKDPLILIVATWLQLHGVSDLRFDYLSLSIAYICCGAKKHSCSSNSRQERTEAVVLTITILDIPLQGPPCKAMVLLPVQTPCTCTANINNHNNRNISNNPRSSSSST